MPDRNGVPYYGAYGGGDNTASQARNPITSTKKLFKAINDENLEDFKQALEEGANVNAFDEEGMTPLISIVNNLSTCSETEAEKKYHSMIRLLLLHNDINVNICENIGRNTALHLAMSFQLKKALQLLLSHPDIKTSLTNEGRQSPEECAIQNRAGHLVVEIQKAQKGKILLDALSEGNIHQVKALLSQELNPNCWKRTQNEGIETPLSLIIKSCLQGITQNNEEVLTKLLKHKDLDFSQIKPIQAIEQNPRVKKIIEQAIKERLTDTINSKDLDDVKKLVEDNCFINCAIVTDAFESIERIKNYLNEKFPTNAEQPLANTHNVTPEINDELIAQELQQLENLRDELTGKEQELDRIMRERASDTVEISQLKRDLKQVREERDRLSSENRLPRTKSLNNKNEKSSEASAQSRKQSNYAAASFVLSGAFAIGAYLTIPNLEICIPLAVAALSLFLIGCYFLYKKNERGVGPDGANERGVGPDGAIDNPRITRVLISSPGSVGNSYTC